MLARPASQADVAALLDLRRRWDTHWFGKPEHDAAELRETFDRVDPLADRSRVLLDDRGRPAAAAWWWAPHEAHLMVDPLGDASSAYDALLPWLRETGVQELEVLGRDTVLRSALLAHGWEPYLSSYELFRADDELPQPCWPSGVATTGLADEHAPAVHDLVYRRACWADVPGHAPRGYDQWRSLFLQADAADQPVLAWRGGDLLGVALGRVFSDGTGWVAQLAVAREQRGHGLGRALLLAAMHRRLAAGAVRLGLSVSAENPDALRLYLAVGLEVDREWLHHRPVPLSSLRPEDAGP